MNVGVILAAGMSTRFNSQVPKQLFEINGKPIIQYSIDVLENCVDDIIIVTNSNCKIETNHTILINDVNDRLQSIKVAIDYITTPYRKVVIHDAARPFITEEQIKNLINSKHQHSQYYMKLVNGLAKKNEFGWEIPNREEFIELCSPQCADFDLFKFIFKTYIETGIQCEVLPCLSYLELEPELIEGHYKYLRKINTLDDIY
jgi:2-C-methyl-D-erythritol 4-phosphate cytidylyltransferase